MILSCGGPPKSPTNHDDKEQNGSSRCPRCRHGSRPRSDLSTCLMGPSLGLQKFDGGLVRFDYQWLPTDRARDLDGISGLGLNPTSLVGRVFVSGGHEAPLDQIGITQAFFLP